MNLGTEAAREADARLRDLLRRCAGSDSVALQRLYELTAPTLFACLTRMLRRRSLAEEVLQDVFVTIWQHAGHFRPERGRPMTWLMSIARYRAIDLLRHERLGAVLVTDIPQGASVVEESEEDASAFLPGARLLERCLALLTREQRHCLELAFVGGSSHADIARRMGSPLGTVKSWIRRALQSLRVCLES
jgi:RNA polymerase sigma-70 factor (ECF subfamily)